MFLSLSRSVVGAMKTKESAEQIASDLFQNCDVPEGLLSCSLCFLGDLIKLKRVY